MKPKKVRYRNFMATGKKICDFVAAHEEEHDHQPVWSDITDHLMALGHPTSQGGAWRQSSAAAALARYCEVTGLDYPLHQRQGTQLYERLHKTTTKRDNEIIITLRITVGDNSEVTVKVE